MSDAATTETTTVVKGSHFWWIPALAGALMIIGGIVMIVWPTKTSHVAAFLIGLVLVVHGILELITAAVTASKHSAWGFYLASGIISLAFGLPLMFASEISAKALAIVMGIFLMLSGLVGIIAGARLRREGFPTGRYLLRGLVAIAVGLAVVLWPQVTLNVIVILVAIWLIVAGVFALIGAFGMSGMTVIVEEGESPD